MTTKELIIGAALLLGTAFTAAVATSSASQAQYYYGHQYGYDRGVYDYYGGYRYGEPNVDRGGPGPRVGAGGGMGIGAQR
jgi:hypothetical protein